MTHTDIEQIRRELAMIGQLYMLGETEVSCVVKLLHKDGRSFISHKASEAECLVDLRKQASEYMP